MAVPWDAEKPMKVIPGLPQIEYPSPVSVRNTFLDTDLGAISSF